MDETSSSSNAPAAHGGSPHTAGSAPAVATTASASGPGVETSASTSSSSSAPSVAATSAAPVFPDAEVAELASAPVVAASDDHLRLRIRAPVLPLPAAEYPPLPAPAIGPPKVAANAKPFSSSGGVSNSIPYSNAWGSKPRSVPKATGFLLLDSERKKDRARSGWIGDRKTSTKGWDTAASPSTGIRAPTLAPNARVRASASTGSMISGSSSSTTEGWWETAASPLMGITAPATNAWTRASASIGSMIAGSSSSTSEPDHSSSTPSATASTLGVTTSTNASASDSAPTNSTHGDPSASLQDLELETAPVPASTFAPVMWSKSEPSSPSETSATAKMVAEITSTSATTALQESNSTGSDPTSTFAPAICSNSDLSPPSATAAGKTSAPTPNAAATSDAAPTESCTAGSPSMSSIPSLANHWLAIHWGIVPDPAGGSRRFVDGGLPRSVDGSPIQQAFGDYGMPPMNAIEDLRQKAAFLAQEKKQRAPKCLDCRSREASVEARPCGHKPLCGWCYDSRFFLCPLCGMSIRWLRNAFWVQPPRCMQCCLRPAEADASPCCHFAICDHCFEGRFLCPCCGLRVHQWMP